jgi:hypothetical protein
MVVQIEPTQAQRVRKDILRLESEQDASKGGDVAMERVLNRPLR